MKPKPIARRWLGAAAAAFLVAACAPTEVQDSTGQYIDDTVLTAHIKSALYSDVQVRNMNVGVETFRGVVQLSGFANSAQERARAEELARSIKGIKSLENDIHVK